MGEGLLPVYLFSGDSFLTEKKYEAVLSQVRSKAGGEVALHTFHLSETPLDSILGQTRSLPFLASAQVFRLLDADAVKEKNCEPLERYLAAPSKTSFLIFEAASIEKSHPIVKLAEARGRAEILQAAGNKSASAAFIREKLRRAEKTASHAVLQRLEDQAGDAPAFLDSILDQLILYAGDRKEITEDMLELFEENWKSVDVFSLTDAILAKKSGRALILLKQILEENDKDLISLLGLLHWQIRRFWQARVLADEGQSEGVILKKCKVSPRQAPFFMRQLKSFSRKKLEECLEGLFQMDWKLKTGRGEGPLELEKWVVQTAG